MAPQVPAEVSLVGGLEEDYNFGVRLVMRKPRSLVLLCGIGIAAALCVAPFTALSEGAGPQVAQANVTSLQGQIAKMDIEIQKLRNELERTRANRVAAALGAATGNKSDAGELLFSSEEEDARQQLKAAEKYRKGLKKDLKVLQKAISKWESKNSGGRDSAREGGRELAQEGGRTGGREASREAVESSRSVATEESRGGSREAGESGKSSAREASGHSHGHGHCR